jgi:hypothetical protein
MAGRMRPGHVTNWGILGVAVFLIGAVLVVHFALVTNRGVSITAFGEGTGRRPGAVKFYETAAEAFDTYLQAQGFQSTTKPPESLGGRDIGFESQNRWYKKDDSWHDGLFVLVVQPTEREAGLHVEVTWRAQGYRSRLDRMHAHSEALVGDLSGWWDAYLKEHPRVPY